jgi:hypothetical protein
VSKWQPPTQKGTELFPDVKGPTVIRVRGVEPGSDQAQRIVGKFASQIGHFHRSQMQKYSLSTIENYRAHGAYPGLKMTYTNLQGQETIYIDVTGEVGDEQQEKPRRLPDWALVQFDFPHHEELVSTEMYAVIRNTEFDTKQLGTGTAEASEWYKPFARVAYAGTASDKDSGDAALTETTDTLKMSLLLDLRPYHSSPRASGVVVDVYAAAIQTGEEQITGYRNDYSHSEVLNDWFSGLLLFGTYEEKKLHLQNQWTSAGLPTIDVAVYVDGVEIQSNLESQQQGNVISVDEMPIAPPVVGPSTGPATGARWQQMAFETDVTTGLITSISGPTRAGWDDDISGGLDATHPYAKYHYTIEPILGTPLIWDEGPGDVAGMVFYGSPDWVWREWNVEATSFKNFRWLPENIPGPTCRYGARRSA